MTRFSFLVLIAALTHRAEAQQARELRLGFTVEQSAMPGEPMRSIPDSVGGGRLSDQNASPAHTALIGAGIGAAAGVVAAVILTNQSNVTDHSEDALGYIALASFGALVGLVVGFVVGFARD